MRVLLTTLLFAAAAGTGILWSVSGRATVASSAQVELEAGVSSAALAAELVAQRQPRESADPASPGSPYDIEVGTHLEFDVTLAQTSGLTQREQAALESLAVRVNGVLVLELLDRRPGELLLRVCLQEAKLSLGATDEASELVKIEGELARWNHVRMREDGQVVGWSLSPQSSARCMQVLESVMSLARFVIPPDAGATWSTREEDASGAYLVHYERRDDGQGEVAVLRRRAEFTPRTGAGAEAPTAQMNDQSTAHFAGFSGWPRRIEGRQFLSMDLGSGELGVEVLAEYSWHLTDRTQVAVSPGEREWEIPWRVGLPLDEGYSTSDSEFDWANTSVESLLLDLESFCSLRGLQSREVYDGRELLKSYLRARPEALEQLTTILMSGGVSEAVLGVALSAIGSVGSETGRAWLAERVLDASWEERPRLLSLLACFQQAPEEDPVLSAAGLLWRDVLAPPALRSTALLLYGRLAKGSPERALALLEEESVARRDGFITSFVSALANAALSQELRRFLDHPDPKVSETARRALEDL